MDMDPYADHFITSKLGSSKKPGGRGGKRGKYSVACDICAHKHIKCDGLRPVCAPCRSAGRSLDCAWTKTPVRKLPTQAHVKALENHLGNTQQLAKEYRSYANFLESLVDQCHRRHDPQQAFDFRERRPTDVDNLLGRPMPMGSEEPENDFGVAGDDETSSASADDRDPAMKSLVIPARDLKIEEDGYIFSQGITSPFSYIESPEIRSQFSRFPALALDHEASYTLLVGDVDENAYNPNFDWSRYLPPQVAFLDRRSHDRALDLLFKFFTSWCLRIIPSLFLRDMYRALSAPDSQPPPKVTHYSPMLHNALVALALAFLDDERLQDLKIRKYFADKAKSYIEAECQRPNLSVVHALSVLASFHSSQGDQSLGYLYFGMSARISQALGLHVDCSEWVRLGLIDEPDRLDRIWTNWTTFSQDVCWSLYVGREFCVPYPHLEFDSPNEIALPFVDEAHDNMDWIHLPSGMDPQPNHLFLTFRATCELLMIARRIMDVVNGLNKARTRPVVIDGLISDIDLQLNAWMSSLAPEIEINHRSRATILPHKLMTHLSYWWLFILLHRPFFHKKPVSDKDIDHVKLCRRGAENIMDLLETWRGLYTLRYCPITLIQTVFSAGTIWLLIAMQASSGMRMANKELRIALENHRKCLQYLHEIGKSWQCAKIIANILKNLMQEKLKPLLDRKKLRNPSISNQGQLQIPEPKDDNEDAGSGLSRRSSRRDITATTRHRRHTSTSHDVSQSSVPPPISVSPSISIFPVQDSSLSPLPSASFSSAPRSPGPLSSGSSLSPHPSGFTASPIPSSPIDIRRPRPESNASASPAGSLLEPWSIHGRAPSLASLQTPSPGTSPSNLTRSMNRDNNPSTSQMGQNNFSHPPPSSQQNYSADPPFSQRASDVPSYHSFTGRDLPDHSTVDFGLHSFGPLDYPAKEFAGFLGMPGGQTLSQAPFVGPFSFGDYIGALSSLPAQDNFVSGLMASSSSQNPQDTSMDTDGMDMEEPFPWGQFDDLEFSV